MLSRTTGRIVELSKNNVRNFSAVSLKEEFPGTPSTTPSIASATSTVSTTSNGITVASNESGKIANVGVIVGSGAAVGKPGTALSLSATAFKKSTEKSALKTVRDIQNVGGTFAVGVDRSSMTYSVTTAPDDVNVAFEALTNSVVNPYLPDWIVTELTPDLNAKKADATPVVEAMNAFYESTYRFSDYGKSMEGPVTAEDLISFKTSEYVTGNLTVVGAGVPHAQLVEFAESLEVPSGSGSTPTAQFHSGNHFAKSEVPQVVVAYEIPASKVAAVKVLSAVWGSNAFVHVNGSTALVGMYAQGSSDELVESLTGTMTSSISFESAKAKAIIDSATDASLSSIASPLNISAVTEKDVSEVASLLKNPSILTLA